ncbi:hypothetical protein C8Q77DRAFT_354453 [Trametes polyzona]|nr:hypothetical protein C8Q77DRAFT_354453 [Trametes polyzona]
MRAFWERMRQHEAMHAVAGRCGPLPELAQVPRLTVSDCFKTARRERTVLLARATHRMIENIPSTAQKAHINVLRAYGPSRQSSEPVTSPKAVSSTRALSIDETQVCMRRLYRSHQYKRAAVSTSEEGDESQAQIRTSKTCSMSDTRPDVVHGRAARVACKRRPYMMAVQNVDALLAVRDVRQSPGTAVRHRYAWGVCAGVAVHCQRALNTI